MQHFPSQTQKQMDILRHPGSNSRNRMKACIFLIEEAGKAKPEFREKIKEFIRNESITLFNASIGALNSIDMSLQSVGSAKLKHEAKIAAEVEEALVAIHKIIAFTPPHKYKDLLLENLYRVIANVLQPEIALKYRRYGFILLIKYVQLAKNAGQAVDEVYCVLK